MRTTKTTLGDGPVTDNGGLLTKLGRFRLVSAELFTSLRLEFRAREWQSSGVTRYYINFTCVDCVRSFPMRRSFTRRPFAVDVVAADAAENDDDTWTALSFAAARGMYVPPIFLVGPFV